MHADALSMKSRAQTDGQTATLPSMKHSISKASNASSEDVENSQRYAANEIA